MPANDYILAEISPKYNFDNWHEHLRWHNYRTLIRHQRQPCLCLDRRTVQECTCGRECAEGQLHLHILTCDFPQGAFERIVLLCSCCDLFDLFS